MARYDFGLSWREFSELTPKMFQALCRRRNVAIKYDRFAHALTASAVYNTSRTKVEDPIVRPFDFVMDDDEATKRAERKKFKQFVQKAIGQLPFNTPLEKLQEKRLRVIADLQASKCANAEELFDSIWPHLKPQP